MVNTIPRDKLGRIVYEGDVLDNGMRVAFVGKRSCALDLEIDLSMSPERTNHERFFADDAPCGFSAAMHPTAIATL